MSDYEKSDVEAQAFAADVLSALCLLESRTLSARRHGGLATRETEERWLELLGALRTARMLVGRIIAPRTAVAPPEVPR